MPQLYDVNSVAVALDRGREPPDNGNMDTTLFATKTDFADLKAEMRTGFAELRADLYKADSAHKSWIVATVLSVLGTGVAVAGFLFTTIRSAAPQLPAPQSTPIIINVPAPAAVPAPANLTPHR